MFSGLEKEELRETDELKKTKGESFSSFYFNSNHDIEVFVLCGEACDCACPCQCDSICDCDCSCPSCSW